jgi:YD repeat-containing protein
MPILQRHHGVARRIATFSAVVSVIAAACTPASEQGEPAGSSVPVIEAVVGENAVSLTDLCEVTACVADTVVLPDGVVIDVAVDMQMPETLGALTVERLWTGSGSGIFGSGWHSVWDIRLREGVLAGPVPSRPVGPLGSDRSLDLADGSRLRFDSGGRLVEMCGSGAHCVTATWSNTALVVTSSGPGGRSVDFELADGRVIDAASSDGRRVSYSYATERLQTVEGVAGTVSYTYSPDGWLAGVDGPRDLRTFDYTDGQLVRMVDRLGGVWAFERPAADVAVVFDPDGGRRTYRFDDGKVTEVSDERLGIVLRRSYAGARLVTEERPLEGVTLTATDERSYRIAQVDADGVTQVSIYTVDERGRVVRTRSGDGDVSYRYGASTGLLEAAVSVSGEYRYEYDDAGLLMAVIDADGYRIDIERGADGLPSKVSDGLIDGSFEYDDAGRVVTESSGAATTRATYDDTGLVTSLVDADGTATRYRYDDRGRLVEVNGPTGGVLKYGISGRLEDSSLGLTLPEPGIAGGVGSDAARNTDGTITYTVGSGSSVTYDEWGRAVRVEAGGNVVERGYDPEGRLVSLAGPSGTYAIAYTPAGRVRSVEREGVFVEVEWYGDLLTRLSASTGSIYEYGYDSGGRLASAVHGPQRWEYAYDDGGRLSVVHSPGGSTRYTWDEASRPVSTLLGSGSEITYEWLGDLIMAVDDPDRGPSTVTYATDTSFAVEVVTPDGTLTLDRDGQGRVTRYGLPDGTTAEVTYGPDGVASIVADGVSEQWSYAGGQLSQVVVGDDVYDVDWIAPGLVRRITRGDEVIVDVAVDDSGRVAAVRDGDGIESAAFRWDEYGITSAVLDGNELIVRRDGEGRIAGVVTSEQVLEIDYNDGAPVSFVVDGSTVTYEYAEGAVRRSTVDDGKRTGELVWSNDGGSLVSFSSTEGDGSFSYDDVGRVIEIAYDDMVRPVTYDDQGPPSAEGTGGEFLRDVFTATGRFAGLATPVSSGPRAPFVDALPAEIGLFMPAVVTGHDVALAALGLAVPDLPQQIVGATPSLVHQRVADLSLGIGASERLTIGPGHEIAVDLRPVGNDFSGGLAASPSLRSFDSVTNRLADAPCILCRVTAVGSSIVKGVGSAVSAAVGFIVDNPAVRAISGALFVAGTVLLTFVCRSSIACELGVLVGSVVVGEVLSGDASGIAGRLFDAATDSIRRVVDRLKELDTLSLAAGGAALATVIATRLLYRNAPLPERIANVVCARRYVVCISASRHPEAAANALAGQAAGVGRFGVVNRSAAASKRKELLSSVPVRFGYDRDEWPPAVLRIGNRNALVAHISPSDNRGAGALIGRQLAPIKDGRPVFLFVRP